MSALSEIEKNKPVKVFFSYSHSSKDEVLRGQLENHLSVLQGDGVICPWHDREITAGTEWENEIKARLNSASVILLLISSDFMASKRCYDTELELAMQRHKAGKARVIPVILRPVDWQSQPFLKTLEPLPSSGKPVTKWDDPDEAFQDVVKGIKKVIEQLNKDRREFPRQGTVRREANQKGYSGAVDRQRIKTRNPESNYLDLGSVRRPNPMGPSPARSGASHHSRGRKLQAKPSVSTTNQILDIGRQMWGFLLLVFLIWVLVGWAAMDSNISTDQRLISRFVFGAIGGFASGFTGGLALKRIVPPSQWGAPLLSWMLFGVLSGALGWAMFAALVNSIAPGSMRDNGVSVGLIFGLIAVGVTLWQLNLQRY